MEEFAFDSNSAQGWCGARGSSIINQEIESDRRDKDPAIYFSRVAVSTSGAEGRRVNVL